ncbi:class I SAM-dependent methyltransferase [Maridesulfovibrio sp.]|uniref:class I SAM-dependent methyltransferase n=1 Tax=Maridesulfovibrio sp. TaxID=2795000 RepID=UPI002A188A9F|nr:class I SAM-dependent methyltransferase [Maridesulfovibrio sp.]
METINFIRTGSYSSYSSAEAFKNVYSQDQKMAGYIYGLALSQFLWPNHYEMFSFYLKQCDKIKNSISRYLEIGPGHGLYLAHSIEKMPNADITAVDISPASIKITRDVLDSFYGDQAKYRLECKDVHEMADSSYDFIVMGEVLEHVDDPSHILKKLHSVLIDDGYLFVTTCANCPAIDHVYLYDGVAAIRDQLESCGFRIVDDLALALSDRPEEEWKSRKELVNYAALLTK